MSILSSVDFAITEEMIGRFAALTGDRSSLHVSDQFARRSAFRRPVAHGMLQVAFLSLARPFQLDGFRCIPTALTGRFLSPVFPGDPLRLTVSGTSEPAASPSEAALEYQIAHAVSHAIVTRGSAAVVYEPRTTPKTFSADGHSAMVSEPVPLNHALLEDITVGDADHLDFAVSSATVREFIDVLGSGTRGEAVTPESLAAGCHLPNLLALLLFSTSVGVCRPGTSATFLEFEGQFAREVELDVAYRLSASVAHRSMATRVVRKRMTLAPRSSDSDVVLRGKVSALVSTPSQRMPSIAALRESALDFGLRDKVALVTGASRGIGETTAKLLAVHGAAVIVNYHRGAEDAKRVVDEIEAAGGQALAVQADVSSEDAVRALVKHTVERYGRIDVLVNNAARDARPIPFQRLTWEDIQKDLDVITKGAFLCCKEVVPIMLEHGAGKIVNISTVFTENPPPDQMKYVIAKSALVGLTRSLSIEVASRNIQVNLVVPNFVETDFVAHVPEGFRKKYAQETPMGRNASPIDVARAVLFLASSHSSFTTGQKVMVTGGGTPYL